MIDTKLDYWLHCCPFPCALLSPEKDVDMLMRLKHILSTSTLYNPDTLFVIDFKSMEELVKSKKEEKK